MKNITLVILILAMSLSSSAMDIIPFRIYKQNGKKTSFRKMIKLIKKSQVVLFGELHNNSICHWLEYETASKFIELHPQPAFAAEMFETDNQEALSNYLEGITDQVGLDSTARLWSNYKTDYAPLVDMAKENNIPFVATNVPRRYASMVYKEGFEALEVLPENEKQWIAPLPIPYDPELPGYKAMLEMGMGHGGENFPKAQAIKDATMGHHISNYLNDAYQVLHFNGTYHSDHFEGIVYYIQQNLPAAKITTISSVTQEDVTRLEKSHIGKANFIICIDENMTPTY